MTSLNGNIFRITGPLWGESTGHRWIPSQRPMTWSFMFSLIYALTNGWANNRDAGNLRRHLAHYDVTVVLKNLHAANYTSSMAFSLHRQVITSDKCIIKMSWLIRKQNGRHFVDFQLVISGLWCMYWLGPEQAIKHDLNQCWASLVYWCLYTSPGLNALYFIVHTDTLRYRVLV